MIWPVSPFYVDPSDANAAFTRPYVLDAERRLRLAAAPPAELEPADPAAVRQLLADVVRRLEGKRP